MTLDFLARAAVQVAMAYALASSVMCAVVALLWARAGRAAASAPQRARRLFWLRLAPTTAGVLIGLLGVLPGYWWLEPRGIEERVGPAALSLAALGVLLLLGAAWRVARSLQASRLVARQLQAASARQLPGLPVPAAAVEAPFPIVALVGLLKPRLFVATRVLDACAPPEVDAIVHHELAHLHARDNLRHLGLRACADLLAWLPAGRRFETAWIAAAEEAADERATGPDPGRRVELAGALVKVARLATTGVHAPLIASALYRGEPIATRVRSLLAPPAPASPARPRVGWLAALAVLTLATAPLLLVWLHTALESLIALGR